MRLVWAGWCVALLASGIPLAVQGQGFGLNEIGSCAVGRGQAVTAAPCADPSLIYWNPGAATMLDGWSAYAGVAAIKVTGAFTSDTTGRIDRGDVPVSFPVHAFVNYTPKSHKWAAGFGAYIPYGLTSQWRGDFPGRFSAQKAALVSVYFQPNFAWQFAKGWSVGGGPVFGYSEVQLRQSLDLSQAVANPGALVPLTFGQLGIPAGTEFGRAKLEGNSTAWGFDVGVHGHIGPDWQVGARYLSQLDFDYDDADATFQQTLTNLTLAANNPLSIPAGTPVDALLTPQFEPGGPLVDQRVSTRIRHPMQFQGGLGYTGFTNTTLSADFVWINYKKFDELPVIFDGPANDAGLSRTLLESYDNSWSIRAGAEHAFAIGIRGRAGFTYVHSPAPDVTVTPLLPDMNRRNFTLGAGIPLGARYTLDAGYLHVDTSGRRGRIVERIAGTPSASETAEQLNSGFYSLSANILSVSIKANW